MRTTAEIITDLENCFRQKEDASILDENSELDHEHLIKEIDLQIESLTQELSQKVDATVSYLRSLDFKIQEEKAAIEYRNKTIKRLQSRVDKIESYLSFHMKNTGLKALEGSESKIKLNESAQVIVHDISRVKECFLRTKIEVDKVELKKGILAGEISQDVAEIKPSFSVSGWKIKKLD